MPTFGRVPPCNTIPYHPSGKPDGVKCGFIGFSPRLNRALLMEATAYLSNFYDQSSLNVGFVATVNIFRTSHSNRCYQKANRRAAIQALHLKQLIIIYIPIITQYP